MTDRVGSGRRPEASNRNHAFLKLGQFRSLTLPVPFGRDTGHVCRVAGEEEIPFVTEQLLEATY